ncbi:MAG: DegT/DnrJ/EryC1/StrS family aminotransferase [Patescibacteria group bacterium]
MKNLIHPVKKDYSPEGVKFKKMNKVIRKELSCNSKFFNGVHIDFLPNFEKDDIQIVKKFVFSNSNKSNTGSRENVEKILKRYFSNGDFYFFSSARGALSAFLKFYLAQNFRKKVLTQGYSCLVVANSIKFAGGIPVFVDIEENSANISNEDLKKNIDKDTGVLIIQNTFGFPADYKNILQTAKENNLFVIENLAHSFGAKYDGKYLGNFGDVALLSFGRNKVISSLIGGALVINNKRLSEQFKKFYETLPEPSKSWTRKQLIHGIISWQAKKYYTSIGKSLMFLLKHLKLSSLEIEPIEKRGLITKQYISKMPDVFFEILENQLNKLEKFNEHRKHLANIYKKEGVFHFGNVSPESEPIYLRYQMFSLKPQKIIEKFKKEHIYIGHWYKSVLAPVQKRLDRFGYYYGKCPNAEKLALSSYNLPTNINTTEEDARLIAKILKSN